jgi:MFS family permease
MIFFGVAYFAQGLAGGLITQPLTYYLKSLGVGTAHAAQFAALIAVPWMIKPAYGLITDFVPLFGRRRKSYLILMPAMAALGYGWLINVHAPALVAAALILTTVGMAATDVVVDAVMVEHGRRTGLTAQFQGQQWIWVNLAGIVTGVLGGWVSTVWAPASALHWAACIVVCAPVAVCVAGWLLVEEPVDHSPPGWQRTVTALRAVARARPVWIVAGFLACWNAVPRFSTPLYYHMTDRLEFSQAFIGELTAVGAIGATLGALLYRRHLAVRYPSSRLAPAVILTAALVTAAHVFLRDELTALVLHLTGGMVGMVALLTFFNMAAAACPLEAAGFTFAALMSVHTISLQVGSMLGGRLYESLFGGTLTPLIWLAAICTAAVLCWVPWLPHASGSAEAPCAEPDRFPHVATAERRQSAC